MIFPSFSTFVPALLAFGVLASSAAPSPNVNGVAQRQTDALSIVQGLKDNTASLLSQVTLISSSTDGVTQDDAVDILTQLTDAITTAATAAEALPQDVVVKRQVTTELGLVIAELVAEILQDVVNIVAGLGTLPLLGPLLLAVDQLLVRLLNALAPTVGGLLLAVASLLFNLGGTNLALLVASLGLGLTAALLGLSV